MERREATSSRRSKRPAWASSTGDLRDGRCRALPPNREIFVRVQTFRRVPPVLPCNFCHPGDCPQWTSIFPSCCLGSLLNRNWSKPWIAQYIAIHSGMSFTVKRLLRTAPKWHTSYLYLSPKIKLFHSKIFYFFSFSLFFSSIAVLFFLSEDISWLLVSTGGAPVVVTV